jgi:outer membrane protein OmpA-like peptidoglycan-associated protein
MMPAGATTGRSRWDPAPRAADRLDGPDLERIERDADRLGDTALAGRDLGAGGPRRLDDRGDGFPTPGAGRALPAPLQARLTRSLGLELDDVRLHDDPVARETTEDLDAEAAISGNDILLGRDAHSPGADRLIAHEVAHMAQARTRPGLPPVLLNGGGSTGIGANPPDVEFTVGTGQGPEDHHVTFAHNSADLTSSSRAALRAVAQAQTGAVEIDLYGYASTEGAARYNVNLSAHRALAVRRLLGPLLPEGSVVRLHAHGETDVFGAPGQNRRVGVDVTERAESTETPSQLPGMPRPSPFPRVSLGVGPLTLGGPIFSGPGPEPEDDPEADDDEGAPSPDAGPRVPAPRLPRSFTLRFSQPISPFSPLGNALLNAANASGAAGTGGLNYLPFARRAALHGQFLPDLMARGELESAYALHRTLYPWIPESADHLQIDNWLLRKAVGLVIGPITAQSATQRGFNAYIDTEYPTLLQENQQQEELWRSLGVIPEAPGLPGPLNLIDGMVFTILNQEF